MPGLLRHLCQKGQIWIWMASGSILYPWNGHLQQPLPQKLQQPFLGRLQPVSSRLELRGKKGETCRPGSAQCGGLKIRASAALPPNTAAATILPPFIISLFCLLLSQSPSPGFGLRPHKSSFATTLAVAGIDVALLLVGTILIICVSRPPCFASSDSCVRSSPTISPISSFPQPCSLQQTSHTTSPFVPTYGSIDKLFLIISPAILAVPPSVRDVFTLDLRRIHLTRLLVR